VLLAAVLVATVPGLAACGDDAAGAELTLEVSMRDFAFDNLPDRVPVGVEIVATNESTTELHEFVAFRLDDTDDRPVAEIVDGDLGAVFGTAPPAAVVLVPPGGEPIVAVGDGTLTEPGRYLIICTIPTGVDPQVYLDAAAASDGPPQVDGGPPHVTHGMYAELAVEA
jgi:hypothetical protein